MIYGSSVGLHSQANHNKTILTIDQTMYDRWIQRMIMYSYYNNPDNLTGLVGEKYQ